MPSERTPKAAEPAAPPDWRRLRLWHIQPVRDILVLALVFGVLYLGYVLRPITVPMLLALLLAYLFEPLVQRLTRSRHISRPGVALGIIAVSFFVIVVPVVIGVAVGVTQTVRLVSNVADNTRTLVTAVQEPDDALRIQRIQALPRGWKSVGKELNHFRDHILEERGESDTGSGDPTKEPEPDTAPPGPAGVAHTPGDAERPAAPGSPPPDGAPAPKKPAEAAQTHVAKERPTDAFKVEVYTAVYSGIEWVRANADTLARSIGQTALTTGQGAVVTAIAFLGGVAFLGFGALLTAFFFFFFSTGWGKVLDFWAGLIPERKKGMAFDLIAKMDRVIAGFVRGRLTICAIMGVLHTIAYWLIGMPMPLVVGPIAGMLYIVPFLHILTIPVGIILLWLQPSAVEWQNAWWWIIFAPIGVDVAGQFLDDWILSPTIQGKTTEMDMPTILFASMAGGALAGMYGLLVAIPVAACIRILFKELFWPRFHKWARGQERDFLPISSAEDSPEQRRRK